MFLKIVFELNVAGLIGLQKVGDMDPSVAVIGMQSLLTQGLVPDYDAVLLGGKLYWSELIVC